MNGETLVIDSSAIIAIFKGEAESKNLTGQIVSYDRRVMSAATWLESAIVCEGASPQGGSAELAEIVAQLRVEIVPFTFEQAQLALEAFKRYGKGRGKPAVLNYGDCFVYALARELDAPLLFKGDDFALTDVKRP